MLQTAVSSRCPSFAVSRMVLSRRRSFRLARHMGLVIRGAANSDGAVEVAIHMEAIDVPEARWALARAQMITHDGLARMAARLNPC